MNNIKKAIEIKEAKISFVSLVDKAANMENFLLIKEKDNIPSFNSFGDILKVDNEKHYITGIVYQPMTEDAHGNFMTEKEIEKAAYWFSKNSNSVDLQHDFKKANGISVVENWVTKSETTINDKVVPAGTWLLTVEITNDDVWAKVEKGEITGFSMGGIGVYSDDDVDISKSEQGFINKFLKALGLKEEKVEKSDFIDKYQQRSKDTNFWTALDTLDNVLKKGKWNDDSYNYDYEENEDKVRETLEEFSIVIQNLLKQDSVIKTLKKEGKDMEIEKSGKSLSSANKKTLKEIHSKLGDFLDGFDNEGQESNSETNIDNDSITKMINEAVQKAVESTLTKSEKKEEEVKEVEQRLTKEEITEIIKNEFSKLTKEEAGTKTNEDSKENLTKEEISGIVKDQLSSMLKVRQVSTNLNDEQKIEKSNIKNWYCGGIL